MPVQFARLSEAIDLLERSVDPQYRLPATVTRPVRKAVDTFVEVLKLPLPRSDEEDLPSESKVDLLRRAGIPVVSQTEHRDALPKRSDQRRAMLGLVRYSG